MKTETPRTDEWETYCDESYYHLWRVRRKNERGFNDGYHVHNGEEAKALVDLLNKQDSELTAARAEISHMVSENGNMYLEIFIARNQRDRLAEACKKLMAIIGEPNSLIDDCWVSEDEMDEAWNIADEALQSLTTNEQ
jgi:hypothetical protein